MVANCKFIIIIIITIINASNDQSYSQSSHPVPHLLFLLFLSAKRMLDIAVCCTDFYFYFFLTYICTLQVFILNIITTICHKQQRHCIENVTAASKHINCTLQVFININISSATNYSDTAISSHQTYRSSLQFLLSYAWKRWETDTSSNTPRPRELTGNQTTSHSQP